ncbi:hypothetical protein BDW74DRAFT_170179 [Aspergillus multicolor]|uniref:uncharacterized protein n=1 Tax=Aspergillus multicolor TaxID=41759 RepID=UPI003CCDEEAC
MEGGFSKAFLMRKADGTEVVAKIPCRIAGPISLTAAAKVGVLEYLKMNTTVPVPRVLSWSPNSTNPVGAEYIIMEKARGVSLFERWGGMPEPKKLQLIRNLSKHEAQFSAIQLNIAHQSLEGDNDNDSPRFCIGPTPDRSFFLDPTSDEIASPRDAVQGPWNTISQLGMSIIKRELTRLPLSNRPSPRPSTFHLGTIEERKRLLESTIPLRDRKAFAKMQFTGEMHAKAYEIATNLENTPAYKPMILPRVFCELFTRCAEVAEFGVLPLRACLVEFFQSWSALGFTEPCPLSFTEEEIAEHERLFQKYQDWHEAHRLAFEALETDAEGWISPQVDVVEKRRQTWELLGLFVEQMVQEKTEEDARGMWPFPDDT